MTTIAHRPSINWMDAVWLILTRCSKVKRCQMRHDETFLYVREGTLYYEPVTSQLKDMHTVEKDREEVVQWNQEGVSPLAGEVWRESRALFRCGDKRQDEPIPPLSLTLQLQSLFLKKLLSLLQVSFLVGQTEVWVVVLFQKRTFPSGCYLDGVDDIVSVQACSQFVDCASVHILQPAEQTPVQIEPVLLQSTQVKALDKLLQLINNLIYLKTQRVWENRLKKETKWSLSIVECMAAMHHCYHPIMKN